MPGSSLTDEDKSQRPEYGFNPVSRRYVLKTSDTWLRLVKSGMVHEDNLESLTLARRAQNRTKMVRAGEAIKAREKSEPEATMNRDEVRRVVENTARGESFNDDDEDLESRLRDLLISRLAPTTTTGHPRSRPRAAAARYRKRYAEPTTTEAETTETETETDY